MRIAWISMVLLASCGGAEMVDGELRVWPGTVNLGITDDGMKFSVPVGASGGSQLQWSNMKVTRPRFSVAGSDTGATLTAQFAGADELIVTSAGGKQVSLPVTVVSYPAGAVDRGRSATERIGCMKAGCHDQGGPDFTPSRIGGFEDRELTAWIVRGTSLETGATIANHSWPITIEEEQDVVAFLRSLAPRGMPVAQ